MSTLRKNPAKIYVKVRADHLIDGTTRPLMLRAEDGEAFVVRAAAQEEPLYLRIGLDRLLPKTQFVYE